jgi:hypothetical protein
MQFIFFQFHFLCVGFTQTHSYFQLLCFVLFCNCFCLPLVGYSVSLSIDDRQAWLNEKVANAKEAEDFFIAVANGVR